MPMKKQSLLLVGNVLLKWLQNPHIHSFLDFYLNKGEDTSCTKTSRQDCPNQLYPTIKTEASPDLGGTKQTTIMKIRKEKEEM